MLRYLTRHDIEVDPVYCPNLDCPSEHWPETADVAIYRESGQTELLDEMPTCWSCGTEMVFPDELRHGRRTCSN